MDKNIENLIWKSEYNIGNLKIDQEHQKLFAIARKTLSVIKLNNDEKEIGKIKELITELFTYVGTHFSNEQKYMKEVKYPELENHILLHKNLLDMLTNLISKLNSMNLKEIEQTTPEEQYNKYKFMYDRLVDAKKIGRPYDYKKSKYFGNNLETGVYKENGVNFIAMRKMKYFRR